MNRATVRTGHQSGQVGRIGDGGAQVREADLAAAPHGSQLGIGGIELGDDQVARHGGSGPPERLRQRTVSHLIASLQLPAGNGSFRTGTSLARDLYSPPAAAFSSLQMDWIIMATPSCLSVAVALYLPSATYLPEVYWSVPAHT